MQIVIEIPNKDIPKHQELVDICLHFIDGHVVEAGGYEFAELPEKTKRQELIDRAYLRANSIDEVRGLAYRNAHIREAKELERARNMIIDLVKELEEEANGN